METADESWTAPPPYRPRNGPLQTVRELLMVRGVTAQMLGDTSADTGWVSILTVDSSVRNVNAAGQDRVRAAETGRRAHGHDRSVGDQRARFGRGEDWHLSHD